MLPDLQSPQRHGKSEGLEADLNYTLVPSIGAQKTVLYLLMVRLKVIQVLEDSSTDGCWCTLSPATHPVSQLMVEAFPIQIATAASNSIWSPSERIFSLPF